MEKKVVVILTGVAAVHAVLFAGLLASGGCRQPEILGTQTYNDGPAMERVPSASDALPSGAGAPTVPGGAAVTVPPASGAMPGAAASAPAALPGLNSVEPAVKSASAAAAGATTYKVVKGDTLSGIAYKHGVRTRELAACNNLDLKSVLRVGQELKIPAGGSYQAASGKSAGNPETKASGAKRSGKGTKSAAPAALPADGVHVVAAGDSLDRIGRRYGVSAKAIAEENDIALTKILHVGDKLRIPAKGASAGKSAADKTAKTAEKAAASGANVSLDDLNPDLPLGTTESASSASSAASSGASSPLAQTESLQVAADMTAEEFCRINNVKLEDLKRLNPDMPADGKLKGGAYMIVPRF